MLIFPMPKFDKNPVVMSVNGVGPPYIKVALQVRRHYLTLCLAVYQAAAYCQELSDSGL